MNLDDEEKKCIEKPIMWNVRLIHRRPQMN